MVNGDATAGVAVSRELSASVCLDPRFSTTRFLFSSSLKEGQGSAVAADSVPEGGLRCSGYRKFSLPGKPLITVATVVFNGVSHLEATLQSVLNLPYDNVELIVIDGGSKDGTLDLIRRYSDRIDYWRSEPDKGIYDAMNKAWAQASSDATILFLGCGDTLLSLPPVFNTEEIFYGSVNIGREVFQSSLRYGLRLGNTLHHQALLIPRRLHPEPPFDTRFDVYADFDFNQRLYRAGHTFRHDDALRAYALPGGVSARHDFRHMAAVTWKNYGFFWACMTWMYCTYQGFRQRLRAPQG